MTGDIPTIRPDADALRALAHPARMRLLGLLRLDGPATATQLAERTGLNSGAASYHLRRLAESGFIEEDATRGSRRDRWWKAAHESTRTDLASTADPAERELVQGFGRAAAMQSMAWLQQSLDERAELPREWADVASDSDWTIRLTAPQAGRLMKRIDELISAAWRDQRSEQAAPDDAAQFIIQLHGFPRPGQVVAPEEP